jgi:signal transduction histidine kinase/ActR/RegA family two-component response regulator
VAAWFGGFGPGLFATFIASVFVDVILARPDHPLRGADAIALALFTLFGFLVSLLVRDLQGEAADERGARKNAERLLKETAHLRDLTATLSRAKTPAEVIQTSVTELVHALGASAGVVALITDEGSTYEIAGAVGHANVLVGRTETLTPLPPSVLTEAIRRHELTVVESRRSANADPQSIAVDDFLQSHESIVVVPLLSAGRASGAIALSFQQARTFGGDERQFLLSAGRHTAQALTRARAYEAAERARADAEDFRVRADVELRERQRVEEALRESESKYRALAGRTSRLYGLSAGLSEAVTVDAVAKVIVRLGKVVVGASAGSVAMLVDGGTQFETLYAEEYPRQVVEAWHRFPAEEGFCSTAAVEKREPIFIASFSELRKHYPRSASIAADGGYASAAVLPLSADAAVIGVLSFHFAAPVNFDDEYTALLRSVAQHCAQALDRARLYEAAQRARTDAETANRSKDDFLSTVSHELRTPLNAMLGWAAMLRSGSLDASRRERAIEAIYNNATRQANLIEELLDVSRIVAGRASLDLQEVELSENLRGAVEAIMPLAASKGLELKLVASPDVNVVADPRRLEQVFLNLLSNAVKFTPEGGHITVDVESSERSIHVRVRDTGPGIDPAFLPHVFEQFRQADSTAARSVGGLGLGLFIARQLVEAQGGSIRVTSEGAGRGATFIVTLPVVGVSSGRTPAVDVDVQPLALTEGSNGTPSLGGVRVLLVDDEPDAREMMASALETCGATVMAAGSARDALQTLAESEVDVLLADIAMPGQDGYDLIREVRALPSRRIAKIPAAAVTAHAREDERQRALSAGFQMHLAKPVRPSTLAETVANLAGIAGNRHRAAENASRATSH